MYSWEDMVQGEYDRQEPPEEKLERDWGQLSDFLYEQRAEGAYDTR